MKGIIKLSILACAMVLSMCAPVSNKTQIRPDFGDLGGISHSEMYNNALKLGATEEWPYIDLAKGHTFQSDYVVGMFRVPVYDGETYYIVYYNPDAFESEILIRVPWSLYCALGHCLNECMDLQFTLVSCNSRTCLTNFEDLTFDEKPLSEYGYPYYHCGEVFDDFDGPENY